MAGNSLDRSVKLSVAEGGLATAMGALISGVFLTGFALALGASRLQIGILFALPALSGVAQLGGSYLLERWGGARRLCVAMSLASRLLYIPAFLVPLAAIHLSGESRVWWMVALMGASHLCSSLGGVAWLSWTKALIPANIRVSFLGRRNLVNTALAFAVCLAGGLAVDAWGSGEQARLIGFAAVFTVAMACGFVSWILMTRIPDAEQPAADPLEVARARFRDLLAAPLREPNFRRIVLFYTAWNLAASVAAPFYPVFFMEKLNLPFWYVIVLATLSSAMGLLANNTWTRLAQRFGMKPVVLIATLGDALFPLALIFVSPQWSWTLLVIHLTGLFNTPHAIGPDNFVLKLAPDRNATPYMAVFRSFVGPATVLAAIFGGWLAGQWVGSEFVVGPVALGGLKIVFLLSFLGRIASLLLLAKVAEPESHTVQYVARVLRRSRRWRRPRRPAVVARAVPA
jgi:Na+/melibiose symporter-like transporter